VKNSSRFIKMSYITRCFSDVRGFKFCDDNPWASFARKAAIGIGGTVIVVKIGKTAYARYKLSQARKSKQEYCKTAKQYMKNKLNNVQVGRLKSIICDLLLLASPQGAIMQMIDTGTMLIGILGKVKGDRDENFPGIPGNLGFSSDFRVFPEWVFVPHLRKKKNNFFLVKMTPN
jgi:hypothetical protein